MSIHVVYRCQSTTACHNVVNCLQAYTAEAASETDISMQNVVLIPSPYCVIMPLHNGQVDLYPICVPTNPADEPSRVNVSV